ncbi:NAD-dependent epimerase/dehydratase family protein [Pasteurella testudinis]|uniref:NAD-dependent epimerase/dehydratase family protein n=1 Tax=Pasteurella testudinis TaxID=761 RepID=UPI004058F7E8
MQQKTALVVGASGVVGRELVKGLCAHPDYAKVIIWLRRPLAFEHPKLQQQIIDFEHIAEQPHIAVDEVFCALGTTIKQAGNRAQFLKVDVEYPTAVAAWAKHAGATALFLVSAPHANPDSRIFYLRAKGQAEQQIRALDYPKLAIFHPPLIIGERRDKRRGQKNRLAVGRLLVYLLSKSRLQHILQPKHIQCNGEQQSGQQLICPNRL